MKTAFRFRAAEVRDFQAIAAIESASLPWAAHWTSESYLCPPGGERWACVAEGESGIAGFVLARWAGGDWEILNLAVDPAARRQGVGRALVMLALHEGCTRGAERAYLEVRESNAPALAFYQRLGFHITGRRRGYYAEPVEDAILMTQTLLGWAKSVSAPLGASRP